VFNHGDTEKNREKNLQSYPPKMSEIESTEAEASRQKMKPNEALAKCLSSPNACIGDPVFPNRNRLDSGLKPAGMTILSTFAKGSNMLNNLRASVVQRFSFSLQPSVFSLFFFSLPYFATTRSFTVVTFLRSLNLSEVITAPPPPTAMVSLVMAAMRSAKGLFRHSF